MNYYLQQSLFGWKDINHHNINDLQDDTVHGHLWSASIKNYYNWIDGQSYFNSHYDYPQNNHQNDILSLGYYY